MSKIVTLAALEAPPAMLADISNFYVAILAKRIIRELHAFTERHKIRSVFNREYISRVSNYLANYTKSLSSYTVLHSSNDIVYKAPLNLSGWQSPIATAPEIEKYFKSHGVDYINCAIHFADNYKNSGLWEGNRWIMRVYVSVPKINSLEDCGRAVQFLYSEKEKIFETVEHELIHMVQSLGYYLTGERGFGLPSPKVRDESVNAPWSDAKPNERVNPNDALQDREFYTNLIDAINEFSYVASFVPTNVKNEYIKYFVGSISSMDLRGIDKRFQPFVRVNHFFSNLKSSNQQKWKLAIKRFIQYLNIHPQILG